MNKIIISLFVLAVLAVVLYRYPAKAPMHQAGLTESEARNIAEHTCIKGGEVLASSGVYNVNTKTWWFDANLNSVSENCHPACVVSEQTKTAEINWRCTGVVTPTPVVTPIPSELLCTSEQRNIDVCSEIYQPVCATVQIQCIRAPCYPVQQTFPNVCNACRNPLVNSYIPGECKK